MVMPDGTWPNALDGAVLDAMLAIRSDALTAVMRAVTFVGNTLSLIAIGVAGVIWLLVRGHRRWAAYCGVTALVAWGLMGLLKVLFGRVRPPIPPRLVEIDSLSFPSGHALNSMVVLGVFAVTVCALTGRRWPLAAALAGTAAIGMSRVYLAAHWMTDVLAGWAVGALVVAVGLWISRRAVTPVRAGPRDRPAAPPSAGP
ncbi:phosphatase PAP2 family protein [Tsukamurella sp. 1534]|uniref:phosphatase PAP2 family protein n=1 Tax=Tsukamurella sp. 1534 TaxID=1151061 RepID=UPI0002EF83C2|nr:phosphatase PAP2 family protein [Tsukamurella sp. 1534]